MNRLHGLRLVATVIPLLVVSQIAIAQPKIVQLTIARHNDAALGNMEADGVLAGMTAVLAVNDGMGDVACSIDFQRLGPVAVFPFGDGSIDTQAEYHDLLANVKANVIVVDQINWCGKPLPGAIGCAPCPGSQIIVERLPSKVLEGLLWAHERGHNCGLDHRKQLFALMRPALGKDNRRINAAECMNFLAGMAAKCAAGGALLAAQADEEKEPLRSFVQQIYVHGIPWDELSNYKAEEISEILPILADPRQAAFHANVIETLAVIGDRSAIEHVSGYIGKGEKISRPEYQAKLAAVLHLGTLHNRLEDRKLLDYLKEGATNPAIWSDRATWTVERRAPDKVKEDLTNMAVWGLALSASPEAISTLEAMKSGDVKTADTYQPTVLEAVEVSKKVKADGLMKYWLSADAHHALHRPN